MIEGLLVKPKKVTPPGSALRRAGSLEVAEAVAVTLATYRELGYAPDVDEATESLTVAFDDLASTGYNGRFFVPAPVEVSFGRLLTAADNKRQQYISPASYLPTRLHGPSIWRPQYHPGVDDRGYPIDHYTSDQLNAGPASAVARLAIFNTAETCVDPVLHFLDKPYDEFVPRTWSPNPEPETTQLEAVEEAKASFAARHEGFELDTLDHRDFVIIALMDRMRGVDPKEQILTRGSMRIAKLGRCAVAYPFYSDPIPPPDYLVGRVSSSAGQLEFGADNGYESLHVGIGLSVGRKSETQ